MDTGLPAGSLTSGAFRRMVKHLLCLTLLYDDDAEKRNDSERRHTYLVEDCARIRCTFFKAPPSRLHAE